MVTKLLMKSLQTRNELLNIAIKASIQAGNIIMKIYNNVNLNNTLEGIETTTPVENTVPTSNDSIK